LTGVLLVVLLLAPRAVRAGDCKDFSQTFNEGQRYFQKDQHLLSAVQFKFASQGACSPDDKGKALFFYALSMNALSEKEEVFHAFAQIEALKVPNLTERINLYKTLELEIAASSSLTANQVERLQQWNHREFQNLPRKSPWLAGTLSAVLPGAGQAYVGAWQSALYSFAINSLFLASALELNRKGLQTTSLAAGAVFSITYFGGILSASQAANLYNQKYQGPKEQELRQQLFPELYP
jgi:hypothetical protein